MQPVDLTSCDREPIHQPGSIQPHGVLIALERRDDQFTIRQVSANVESLLDLSATDMIGKPLEATFRDEDASAVLEQLRGKQIHYTPIYLRRVHSRSGRSFDAIAHLYHDWHILEIESIQQDQEDQASRLTESGELYRSVQSAIASLRAATSIAALSDRLAHHVRSITGFDRVMVYRFDEEWNGSVISEERRSDLEPFLGLHYPAADIPKQARELYARNWLRFIPDREYSPVPMIPSLDPFTNAPLDMSYSVLRSVSPIHIEYLRNMGVGASMSISLIDDGKLWGLVACHHYSPRHVPYVLRSASETLGQFVSLRIAMQHRKDLEEDIEQKNDLNVRLVDQAEPNEAFAASLIDREPNVMALVDCTGAAVVMNETVSRIGQTPSNSDLLDIAEYVCKSGKTVFSTNSYALQVNKPNLASVASGVLAATFAREGRRAILWFRPEQVRTVDWAGDPSKSVVKGETPARLSPRGSFALWKETVRGQSVAWTEADKAAVARLRTGVFGKLLVHADDVSRHNEMLRRVNNEREQALESERAARSQAEKLNRLKDDFVATLSHELRTPLTAIQGWAQLLRSRARDPEKTAEGLEIIERNARIQSQMIGDLLDMSRITSGKLRLDVQAVDVPPLIEAGIATTQLAADSKNIEIQRLIDPLTGVSVSGDPTRLQQVAWNLISNAIKFTPRGGKIIVELKRTGSYIELSVRDNGIGISADFLPHVFDRFRQADASSNRKHGGLGLGLAIVRHLVEMHGGTIFAESPGINRGTTFTVTLPIRAVRDKVSEPHPLAADDSSTDCHGIDLKSLRVLVVDDEPDTRNLVANVLRDCKVQVTTASSAAEAMLHVVQSPPFDVMVSDIGMPGTDGYGLMKQLREFETERNLPRLPAVALTAYARSSDRRQVMLAGFQMHIAKPVDASELLAVVANLADRV